MCIGNINTSCGSHITHKHLNLLQALTSTNPITWDCLATYLYLHGGGGAL